MKFFRNVVLVGILALSLAAAVSAQNDVNFNDGRINNNQLLGGIGIYCENQNGVASRSYENGGISVWNALGDKVLFASAVDIAAVQTQFPQVDGATTGDQQADSTTAVPGRTGALESLRFGTQNAGLLAVAQAQQGPYRLYGSGTDSFYLLGQDEYGRQFLYQWTGCNNDNAQFSNFTFPQSLTAGVTRNQAGVGATVTADLDDDSVTATPAAPTQQTTPTLAAPTLTSPDVTPTAGT